MHHASVVSAYWIAAVETNHGDIWIVVVCIRTIHLEVNTFLHFDHGIPRASVAYASLQQCSAADNQLSLSVLGSDLEKWDSAGK